VLDRVLPVEDEEISQFAHKAFIKQGMKIKVGTNVEKLEKGADNVTAALRSKDAKSETIVVDRVILAIGIVGNVENNGFEQAGVKVERTHVVVNEWGKTGVEGIWAIGDLVGPPWLAHKGMHEGVIVAERIAGVEGVHPLNASNVPGCTYCWPQVASVGLTEAAAKTTGRKIRVGKFPFIGNGKAIALGEPEGLVKTVFDAETGELLGAHMIGAEVTELIQGYVIAKTGELTDSELASTIFPHPTLSEMMHEAVLAADGRALHI
jgi:dihydrolipoamide dehydrogenase